MYLFDGRPVMINSPPSSVAWPNSVFKMMIFAPISGAFVLLSSTIPWIAPFCPERNVNKNMIIQAIFNYIKYKLFKKGSWLLNQLPFY